MQNKYESGINRMNKSTQHYWNEEEDQWIKEHFSHYKKRSTMLLKFNQAFNCNITINSLNQRLYKYKLLMPNSNYTPEMEDWLQVNYRLDAKSVQQLTDEFNAAFGTKLTKSSIWHKAFRLTNRRVSDEPRRRLKYTPEMLDRIRELVPKWSYKKVAEMLTEEYNYKFSASMIEHKANRLGIKKEHNGFDNLDPRLPSLNWFTKGRPSLNEKPIGTETIMEYSTGRKWIHVKVAKDRWEYKHRLVWEQHNGEIPEGYIITFIDGNTLNCDINNLRLISPAENVVINRKKLRNDVPELFDLGLDIAKLTLEIGKKKRKKKNEEK